MKPATIYSPRLMQTSPLGQSTLRASRLAYGCWRLAGTWEPSQVTADGRSAGRRAVLAAIDAGYTVFDLADIYCGGECERIFGALLRETPSLRKELLIVSKCGIRFAGDPPGAPYRYDASSDHIVRSCEHSLQRLGVDTLDLYLLHRPDLLMYPAEVAAAFDRLHDSGKVREFGVSNYSPSQVNALQSACRRPLTVNQIEVSLARLDAFEDGTLDQCLASTLTPMAWSPLAGGKLADGSRQVLPSQEGYATDSIRRELNTLATALGTCPSVVALAWLLQHPAGIVPIIGTTHPDRIREAAKADGQPLSREDWYRLFVAARGHPLP